MTYRGVPPKDDADRIRRNKTPDRTHLEWDGEIRGPELPGHIAWNPYTEAWYEGFRCSPQSMVCAESDWLYIIDTALLHNRMHNPDCPTGQLVTLASEFRRRMSSYGYIHEDRQKLRMDIESPLTQANEEARVRNDAAKAINYASMLTEEAAKLKE